MDSFRTLLRQKIDASEKYRGRVYQLALDANLGRKSLYNMLRDQRLDTSKTGPGLFAMSRVANLLETSLDDLVGPPRIFASGQEANAHKHLIADHVVRTLNSQGSLSVDRLSVDILLRLHMKSGGRIEAFEPYMSYCDQYFAPTEEASRIVVQRVGNQSLAAITMGQASCETLQIALDNVEAPELRQRWLRDYREALNRGTLVTLESLDVQMPNRPIRVKIDFMRCLLGVQDQAGEHSLLNFSLLVV